MSNNLRTYTIAETWTQIYGFAANFLAGTIASDVSSDVKTAFLTVTETLLQSYGDLGLHLIGKYRVFERVLREEPAPEGLEAIVKIKLTKYLPYLKVLNDEFIKFSGVEKESVESEDSLTRTNNSTEIKDKDNNDSFSNTTSGTNRSAHESSPVSVGPISNAPSESSVWNMNYPDSKDGEQFKHTNESYSTKAEDERIERRNSLSDSAEGSKTIERDNGEMIMRVLKFNIEELNLTRVVEMFVSSLVEEKNTIY